MPTTDEGIYELVLEQTYGAEKLKNVFHYRHSLGSDDEQNNCADAFNEDVLPALKDLQNTLIAYTEVRVANLTGDLADASHLPSFANGVVAGDVMPSFTAFSYKYVRTSKDTRNGAKRFGGVIEENVTGNNWLPAFFTDMQLHESTLSGQIDVLGHIFVPIILRKPDVAGLFTYNDVANVLAQNRVTTQNSRKAF